MNIYIFSHQYPFIFKSIELNFLEDGTKIGKRALQKQYSSNGFTEHSTKLPNKTATCL